MLSCSFSASLIRAAPERSSPSISTCAAGSTLSWPIRTRLSRWGNDIEFSSEHDMRAVEDPGQEWMTRATPAAEFVARIQRGADTATEIALGVLQGGEDLLERQVVGDHQHVDVAHRSVGLLRDRSVQQRESDPLCQRGERSAEPSGDTRGLLDDRV